MKLWIALVLGATYAPWVSAGTASLEAIAQGKQWRRLLHVSPRLFGLGQKSEVEPSPFFMSPMGRTDFVEELRVNLKSWRSDPAYGCRFPARARFFVQELGEHPSVVPCPELEKFLGEMAAHSVTLIFSSAYANSPPSMFGHTFLRINSGIRPPLSDYAINYSATSSGEENALAFAAMGLLGGYPGRFGVTPFSLKVAEYAYSESRDLWEYDLSLTESETRLLLLHLWELDHQARFSYYFVDENCSYRLLKLLEVARPDWDVSRFALHAIPGETVKRIAQTPGAVVRVGFRPSLRRQAVSRFEGLSPSDQDLVLGVSREMLPIATLRTPEAADALVSLLRLKDSKSGLYREALAARSRLGLSEDVRAVDSGADRARSQPDLGHGAYSATGWIGNGFGELQLRVAYHDLLDSDDGYEPWTHVDFPNLTLKSRWSERPLYLESLGVLSITSLVPMSAIEKPWSWKFDLGWVTPKDLGCPGCHALHLEGGLGLTAGRKVLGYGLGEVWGEAGSLIGSSFRAGPAIEVGALSHLGPRFKVKTSGAIKWDLLQQTRPRQFYPVEIAAAYALTTQSELRVLASRIFRSDRQGNDEWNELKVGLRVYW